MHEDFKCEHFPHLLIQEDLFEKSLRELYPWLFHLVFPSGISSLVFSACSVVLCQCSLPNPPLLLLLTDLLFLLLPVFFLPAYYLFSPFCPPNSYPTFSTHTSLPTNVHVFIPLKHFPTSPIRLPYSFQSVVVLLILNTIFHYLYHPKLPMRPPGLLFFFFFPSLESLLGKDTFMALADNSVLKNRELNTREGGA